MQPYSFLSSLFYIFTHLVNIAYVSVGRHVCVQMIKNAELYYMWNLGDSSCSLLG